MKFRNHNLKQLEDLIELPDHQISIPYFELYIIDWQGRT